MIRRLRVPITLVITGMICAVLAGCGGASRSPVTSNFGTASFTIEWPARAGGAILAESIRIVISNGRTTIANRVVNRSTGNLSTATIEPIPAGSYVVSVTAYPQPNTGGAPDGEASAALTVRRGETSSITFTALAQVDRVEIAADSLSVPVNGTIRLTATPRSVDGAVVLVASGSMTWESLNTPTATVDANGTVTGVAAGSADIKATENGSGLSAVLQITVTRSRWTVMVYMAGDNNLETYAIQDINEMETVGSTSEVSVVVQVDRSPDFDTSNGNWSGARRYFITKDAETSVINSQLIQDLGPTDMAQPNTLEGFIHWATDNYTAEHYLLVLWDHGRGWRTRTLAPQSVQRQVKAIFIDQSTGNEMSLLGLQQALEQSPRTDILLFDACLMGMLEVAYSVRNSSEIMIASEENVPVQGQPYGEFLSKLAADSQTTPEALSRTIVDDYMDYYSASSGTFTLSAVNLLMLDDVVSSADELAGAILADMSSVRVGVELAQADTQPFDSDKGEYRYYRDLYDFARLVSENVASNAAVRSAADQLTSAVDSAVIYERHLGNQVADSHGLSIYLPDPRSMLRSYDEIEFSLATRWDELVSSY